ncbi:TetR/AcrR family transcriptional regulator [Actinoallomurus sp. CA-142502]|uniref:TetR/AcrR family transcriptional regulator n=1 Tax=Actinoallomurus sp. CA-142502 TaxID=3239885 RepID=UPI003D8DD419
MSESLPRRLPRGRHALSRDELERIQRARLCAAMAEVMAEKGYVATSVADVLARSGVSRQTFYQVFDSKLDCFMTAFEFAADLLMQRLLEMVGTDESGALAPEVANDPLRRFELAFTAYLEVLAAELPYTRLFLIEVYAAGSAAVQRRSRLQGTITTVLADLLGVTDEAGRFTCQTIVAATSAMVTNAAAENDVAALRAVGPPLIDHIRVLWKAGAFGRQAAPSSR